ncbi:hypothetical protein M3Y98_00904100 [Aphelenchoides besseyi]|nr:hypothetical protein M3Y98_00904100 [Aphelenchoides besseyi]
MSESTYKANRQHSSFDGNLFLLIVRNLRRRIVSLFWSISLFLWYKSVDCDCFGENFCFIGTDNQGHAKRGIRFDCSLYSYLSVHKLLDRDAERTPPNYENLSDDWIPIFVTPCSSNHFNESRVMVKVIRETYKNAKIVYYDIGLTAEEVDEVQSWCNVEYRKFNFSAFPSHVSSLKSYAFKIVMIEALQEWPSFFYIDSSVRIREPILHRMVDAVKNGSQPSILSFNGTRHSIFATAYPSKFVIAAKLQANFSHKSICQRFPIHTSDSEMVTEVDSMLTIDFQARPLLINLRLCWKAEVIIIGTSNVMSKRYKTTMFIIVTSIVVIDSIKYLSIGVNLRIGNYNRTGYEEFKSRTKLGDVIHYTRDFQRLVEVGRGDTIDHRLEVKC